MQHREPKQMIGVRMRHVDERQVLLRLENLRRQTVRFAQRKLRVDHQHVLLAGYHGRVDVVPIHACAVVHLQGELGLSVAVAASATRGKKNLFEHREYYILGFVIEYLPIDRYHEERT